MEGLGSLAEISGMAETLQKLRKPVVDYMGGDLCRSSPSSVDNFEDTAPRLFGCIELHIISNCCQNH